MAKAVSGFNVVKDVCELFDEEIALAKDDVTITYHVWVQVWPNPEDDADGLGIPLIHYVLVSDHDTAGTIYVNGMLNLHKLNLESTYKQVKLAVSDILNGRKVQLDKLV